MRHRASHSCQRCPAGNSTVSTDRELSAIGEASADLRAPCIELRQRVVEVWRRGDHRKNKSRPRRREAVRRDRTLRELGVAGRGEGNRQPGLLIAAGF